MKTIRYNTFETNSSSCHTVTIVKKDTYERYKNGELVCLFNFNLCEDVAEHIVMSDDSFYDIDAFYELIQKRKEFYTNNNRKDVVWLFNAPKEEIKEVFFDGKFDNANKSIGNKCNEYDFYCLGHFLRHDHCIYSANLNNDVHPIHHKIKNIKELNDGFVEIKAYVTV